MLKKSERLAAELESGVLLTRAHSAELVDHVGPILPILALQFGDLNRDLTRALVRHDAHAETTANASARQTSASRARETRPRTGASFP
jgi:hypothetical protein